jgi:hypothetical protein
MFYGLKIFVCVCVFKSKVSACMYDDGVVVLQYYFYFLYIKNICMYCIINITILCVRCVCLSWLGFSLL